MILNMETGDYNTLSSSTSALAASKGITDFRDERFAVAAFGLVDANNQVQTAAELGGGGFQTETLTLDNEQIKALPTTPIVIIPATEVLSYAGFPSSLVVVHNAFMVLDSTSGAYTNVNAEAQFLLALSSIWDLTIGRTLELQAETPYWHVNDGFDSADKHFMPFVIACERLGSNSIQDNAIAITAQNGLPSDGVFTGGNSGNTLKVTINYTVITT